MTDIVDRLRALVILDEVGSDNPLGRDAAAEIERLRKALQDVVSDINDYERINNLAPSPGRTECWDSIARAKSLLAALALSSKESE